VQDDRLWQATPVRALITALVGFWVLWIAHFLPFQLSARVTPAPEALMRVPTATQDEAVIQVPKSSSPVGAARFRVGTTDQPLPGVAGDVGMPMCVGRCPWTETAAAGLVDAAMAITADIATAIPVHLASALIVDVCTRASLSRPIALPANARKE